MVGYCREHPKNVFRACKFHMNIVTPSASITLKVHLHDKVQSTGAGNFLNCRQEIIALSVSCERRGDDTIGQDRQGKTGEYRVE